MADKVYATVTLRVLLQDNKGNDPEEILSEWGNSLSAHGITRGMVEVLSVEDVTITDAK